jgi:ribosomal protein S27AE
VMRGCNRCGERKPEGEFYARQGTCKDCMRAAHRAYAKANPGIMQKHGRKWKAENPEKRRAENAVTHAIEDGLLVRLPCERCGDGPAHAHHDDYSKPLEVRWLCARCHRQFHAGLWTWWKSA